MIKYIYFNTNENHWFDVANKLYKEKIAEPILWLEMMFIIKAYKYLGIMLLKVLIWCIGHMNFQIQIMRQNQKFIFSENYYRSKDMS